MPLADPSLVRNFFRVRGGKGEMFKGTGWEQEKICGERVGMGMVLAGRGGDETTGTGRGGNFVPLQNSTARTCPQQCCLHDCG